MWRFFARGVLLALIAWAGLLLRQRAIVEQRETSIKSELGQALRRLPSFVAATLLYLAVVGCGAAGAHGDVAAESDPGSYPARGIESLPGGAPVVYLAGRVVCGARAVGRSLRQSARLCLGKLGAHGPSFISSGAPWVVVVAVLLGALIAAIVSSLGGVCPGYDVGVFRSDDCAGRGHGTVCRRATARHVWGICGRVEKGLTCSSVSRVWRLTES